MYDVTIFIFYGLLQAAIGVPFFLKKVPPNRIFGYKRILKLNDKELWYSIYRLFGQNLILSGIILILLSVIIMLIFRNAEEEISRIINTVIMIVLLALAIIRCEIYLSKNKG
ncbi:MAG: SdpI family protein [Spirochaetales bacterium]|uniref:SdpI family protein n=1 Tax=Candidatus Thalassospirochaeta sargassi TaxID=3119039 RepID=A0AAJ1MI92_9SPIO|nr:SdpI family protein [Spirochaetales bacterium]